MAEYIEVPFEIKESDIKEDGSFSGYGSLFDRKPDAHRDIISPGAFTKTLADGGRNGTGVAMLWQHNPGSIPGVWSQLREDRKGLFSAGRLALKTGLGSDVYEILKLAAEMGTFKLSQSIGYDAVEYEVDEKKKIRDLKVVDLWELSLVTFPAKLGATVVSVKRIEDAKTERDFENVLRDANLSKSAARYIVHLWKQASLREAGDGILGLGVLSGILDGLKETNEDLNDFLQFTVIKSVIPFRSHDLADENSLWDAGTEVKKSSVDDLRIMCAWHDADFPDNKGSYKLPHHLQEDFKTVWRGVANSMAKLLHPVSSTKIPNRDRKGCYNHLLKHYKEFGKDAPDFKDYEYQEWGEIFPTSLGLPEILDSLVEMNL